MDASIMPGRAGMDASIMPGPRLIGRGPLPVQFARLCLFVASFLEKKNKIPDHEQTASVITPAREQRTAQMAPSAAASTATEEVVANFKK